MLCFAAFAVPRTRSSAMHTPCTCIHVHPHVYGTCIACACTQVPYVVQGVLLLPLELWSAAREAAAPYKLQPRKLVERSQVTCTEGSSVHAVHVYTCASPHVHGRLEHAPRACIERAPTPCTRARVRIRLTRARSSSRRRSAAWRGSAWPICCCSGCRTR